MISASAAAAGKSPNLKAYENTVLQMKLPAQHAGMHRATLVSVHLVMN
jgi:hypothetical protein